MFLFSLFLSMFTIAWESVEKTDLLVLYHVLTPSVYTGGGDPHSQASRAYFCIAGQTNPLRSQEQWLGQFTWESALSSIYLRIYSKKSFFSSQTLIKLININTPTGLIYWLILKVLNVLNISEFCPCYSVYFVWGTMLVHMQHLSHLVGIMLYCMYIAVLKKG